MKARQNFQKWINRNVNDEGLQGNCSQHEAKLKLSGLRTHQMETMQLPKAPRASLSSKHTAKRGSETDSRSTWRAPLFSDVAPVDFNQ